MIHSYLTLPDLAYISEEREYNQFELGYKISLLKDDSIDLYNYDIAILGVKEARNSNTNNLNADMAPDEIRKQLFRLKICENFPKVIDLGNIRDAETVEETCSDMEYVLTQLYKSDLAIIILGGSHDLTVSQFKAFEEVKPNVSVTIVDERVDLDLTQSGEKVLSDNFLEKIIKSQSPKLYTYSQLGVQEYFTIPKAVQNLKTNFFNLFRLGQIRYNLPNFNHALRMSDMVSIDISAVKQSDAPARNLQSPNGLNPDELCQITRMTGMSSDIYSIGIYEVNPQLDFRNMTTQLVAQAVWYFIEGYTHRVNDRPDANKETANCKEYMIEIPEFQEQPVTFYKSNLTQNWWVKFSDSENAQYFPCSKIDYETCVLGDISPWLMNLMSKVMV